ncbi:MAG: 16S rRNA (guanine(966)-N(2))-methyltransferase RsmD [Elusimicrobiota bacterium]
MQKILSGSARGRSLLPLPKGLYLRPILSRIKKSLFDILHFRLPNCTFLDLYAGTGSVGMEALSNGAKKVVFIEKNRQTLSHLQSNLDKLGFRDKSETFSLDVTQKFPFEGPTYDIIFMGPPYVDENKKPLSLSEPTLSNIINHKLLNPKGVIIIQHHQKEKIPDQVQNLIKFRTEKYGDTLVDFFRFVEDNV